MDNPEDGPSPVRFNLEMFPAEPNSDITGNFLVDLVERHRTGAAGISDSDRWMLESQSSGGGVTLPRLRWAKKNTVLPQSSAHMAIAFDSFDTRVDFLPLEQLASSAPLHVYGLVANIQRAFTFVEVKYRRNLRAARSPELVQLIDDQTQLHREAWMDWYFDGKVAEPLLAIRRSRLVRALRFYLEKAHRHHLDASQHDRFRQQLDRLMTEGINYKLTEPADHCRGYIFCPEFTNSDPVKISDSGAPTKTILFGATTMPDLAVGVERSPAPNEPMVSKLGSEDDTSANSHDLSNATPDKPIDETKPPQPESESADGNVGGNRVVMIRFGADESSGEPVEWSVSSYTNPHLMTTIFLRTLAMSEACSKAIRRSCFKFTPRKTKWFSVPSRCSRSTTSTRKCSAVAFRAESRTR